MRKLSAAVDRFAYNHPRFGIPNLMKFIVIGNVLVYLLSLFAGYGAVSFLNFQWAAITHGRALAADYFYFQARLLQYRRCPVALHCFSIFIT